MVHRLSNPNEPRNATGLSPMTVALRYRCDCGDKELLQIQVVMDFGVDEYRFAETMRALWKDMKFEVAQHLKDQS